MISPSSILWESPKTNTNKTTDTPSFGLQIPQKFVLPTFISTELAKSLLSYFCNAIAPKFSVFQDTNSLVRTYLPLAAYDNIVLKGILLWSILHMETKDKYNFSSAKTKLINDINRTLALTTNPQVTMGILLIMISVSNKQGKEWLEYYDHAKVAASLCADSEQFNWLKNNLVYHEITAPTLLMVTEPRDYELDELPESYMGLSKPLYLLHRQIFSLSKTLLTTPEFWSVYQAVEVLDRKITQTVPLMKSFDTDSGYHLLFFKVLRNTTRICLRQFVRAYLWAEGEVEKLIVETIGDIDRIFGTDLETSLLFPIFIIGIEAVGETRDWVIYLLRRLHERVGSGNIMAALDFLQLFWNQIETEGYICWHKFANENNMHISLA